MHQRTYSAVDLRPLRKPNANHFHLALPKKRKELGASSRTSLRSEWPNFSNGTVYFTGQEDNLLTLVRLR